MLWHVMSNWPPFPTLSIACVSLGKIDDNGSLTRYMLPVCSKLYPLPFKQIHDKDNVFVFGCFFGVFFQKYSHILISMPANHVKKCFSKRSRKLRRRMGGDLAGGIFSHSCLMSKFGCSTVSSRLVLPQARRDFNEAHVRTAGGPTNYPFPSCL